MFLSRSLLCLAAFSVATSFGAEVKIFRAFTLIDGTGSPPAPNSAMVVSDGRIAWIGPGERQNALPPVGAQLINRSGKWADFMVLNADPVADIRNSRAIQSVYIAGNHVG